jgi:hypothetical protein
LDKEIPYYKTHKVINEESKDDEAEAKIEDETKVSPLSLVHLDFVATIHTKSGEYKKVLIELQKSKKPTDLLRFRTYLGEQYKKTDTISVNGVSIEQSLPIVAIYILGFPLSGIEATVVKVGRIYEDVINNIDIKNKSRFIESLTHDGYFLQVPRINKEEYEEWEKCGELKQMLSLFEQDNFKDNNFYKEYKYPITNKNIKKMVETLAYIAADPIARRTMQEEYWAALDEQMWENQLAEIKKDLAAKDKENEKLHRILQQLGVDISQFN